MNLLEKITLDAKVFANPLKAKNSMRFFKTGPGQYGEGDIFWGLTVAESRTIAKNYFESNLRDIEPVLQSPIHELRLIALQILKHQFEKSTDSKEKNSIVKLYLKNTQYINNWDLVDTSASYIYGEWLRQTNNPEKLYVLAKSKKHFERRIAMISVFTFIKHGSDTEVYELATTLMNDSEDLMHKAVGWMLRESGKRVSKENLKKFLDKNAKYLARTTLRYSIEHFTQEERMHYMKL